VNQKGIVLSGLIYVLLTFFILLLVTLLAVLWYRQNTADALRSDTDAIYDDIYISEFSKEFAYTGNYQTFFVPVSGDYKIELWGAQGGSFPSQTVSGGKGAYVTGTIFLKANTTLYLYIGSQGTMLKSTAIAATFNGGGATPNTNSGVTAGSGGGATDVRLVSGAWSDTSSLRSRIIVAAGGGSGLYIDDTSSGYPDRTYDGGYAGGLTGGAGSYATCSKSNLNIAPTGGLQTAGGMGGNNNSTYSGKFGIGGNSSTSASAGGGGYYGGGGGIDTGWTPSTGAGGSSFISGYSGCNAIDANGVHTGQPNHFSGYIFNNSQMIAGNAVMPSPTGVEETGHTGNGYAKITYLP
jgi:hypothetical protein